jgi:hypothetical protein
MASEGDFPKTDGDTLYETDVNASNVKSSRIIANELYSGNMSKLSQTGYGNGLGDGSYSMYSGETIYEITSTGTKNSSAYLCSDTTINKATFNANVTVMDTYDHTDDSSIDATLWTTTTGGGGALTMTSGEGATYLWVKLNGSPGVFGTNWSIAYVDGSGSNDFIAEEYFAMMVEYKIDADTGYTRQAQTVVTDDTSTVHVIHEWSSTSETGTRKHFIECFNDTTNDILYTFVDGVFEEVYDYGAAGLANLRIGVRAYCSTGGTGNITALESRCYFLGTTETTPDSTVTYKITADAGSNWETTTNGYTHLFSNAGKYSRGQLDVTKNANEIILVRGYSLTVDD